MNLFKIYRKANKSSPVEELQESTSLAPATAAQLHEKVMAIVHPVIYSEPKPDRETLMYASIAATINTIIDDGRLVELYYRLDEMFPEYDYVNK